MGDPSPYQYTYKDIERYHAGEMSPEEMNRMERVALDDPFLADALEGYSFTSTPNEDLNKLKEKLSERTKRKRSVIWITKNYNWLKVAAVFLFVLAGSWLLVVSKQKHTSELALDKKEAPKLDNEVNNASIDSAFDKKNADSENEINKDLTFKNDASVPKRKTKYHFNLQKDSNAVATVTPNSNPENAKPSMAAPAKDNASTAQITQTTRMGVARSSKAESNQNKDSIDKIKGYSANAKKQPVDTIKNIDVVMKPQAVPGLSEVVITKSKAARKPSRSPFVIVDTLEPEEGWAEYNDYVVNNLKSPEETKVKSLTGEVELSFDVNESGRPINIKVEKSLCDPCDTEAIRLLAEGPNWKKKKNKKGKLRIHF